MSHCSHTVKLTNVTLSGCSLHVFEIYYDYSVYKKGGFS